MPNSSTRQPTSRSSSPEKAPLTASPLIQRIAETTGIDVKRVAATVQLLDDGNSLPFIARYRKEATQGLDEMQLRAVEDQLHKERELESRKQTILKSIDEQGMLDSDLRQRIEQCFDKQTLEAIYLPYKPKRRTRATAARERGLQPLADLLLKQETLGQRRNDVLDEYVNPELEVPDREAALQGACDIVAETWADREDVRTYLLEQVAYGYLTSSVKRGKRDEESKFAAYFDFREPIRRARSHRILALKRGEAEGVLNVGIELDEEHCLRKLKSMLITNARFEFHNDLVDTLQDSYRRLMQPATQSAALQTLKEQADEEAITVFAKNLRELLLAPPAGPRITMGIDPGFRTGCKVAVVDATGKFLANETIYPTPPKSDTQGAEAVLRRLIDDYDVQLIAIGNGTASRETDAFVTKLMKQLDRKITKVVVSEAGASVYSASELAAQEYPQLDLTVRGAISIAHRLQDPLAELVKIDPKAIGVGQYQHDVNQTLLRKALEREVESCVTSVGVELNQASVALLSHVSGIGPKLAQNIVSYREANGRFDSRSQLNKVPKLGKKAFEQAAGFLRIRDGKNPLDNSAVHPESYYIVEQMARVSERPVSSLVGNAAVVRDLDVKRFIDERTGELTINDILEELAKPGRDPRDEFRVAKFSESVQTLEDLKPGLVLEGTVTNVTQFGAFVDVGVHQDGLVHISELDNQFVQDPSDVVSVGDIVRVKVLDVDLARKRIALSRKQLLS